MFNLKVIFIHSLDKTRGLPLFKAASPMIGVSFSSLADYLKMYSSYCSSHHASLEHLEAVTKKHTKLASFLQGFLRVNPLLRVTSSQ